MTGQEYKEFQKLGSIDRIVRMTSGTIKQNFDFLVGLVDAENGMFDKEKNV